MNELKTAIFKTCPKTGRIRGVKSNTLLFKILFPVTGLLALTWVLMRIIPKPSRINYPCVQVAVPHAGAFVGYLTMLAASFYSLKRFKKELNQGVYLSAAICLLFSLVAFAIVTERDSMAAPYAIAAAPVANVPIGVAKGIMPGRVVWKFDRDATSWPGAGHGHWWESDYTDQTVVNQMFRDVLHSIAGESDDATAWNRIFQYYNDTHGKGTGVGYQDGEKIMIKVNNVGFIAKGSQVNSETYQIQDLMDIVNSSPQMMHAVLDQLTNVARVPEENIYIGDPTCFFPKDFIDFLIVDFPGVNYLDYYGGNEANPRTGIEFSDSEVHWSTNPEGVEPDYIPTCYTEASYVINIATMKTHGTSGITSCAKNHYGSLHRYPVQEGYFDLHVSLAKNTPEVGSYRALVDLMGHKDLGGKTLLFLVDGLYAGVQGDSKPYPLQMQPFNGDWSSSIFGSQDGVALESVIYDFLREEWPDSHPNMVGADDYLVQAAMPTDASTFYDPNGDGIGLSSLGVHEHWNNAEEKQYSGNGIELVQLTDDRVSVLSFSLFNVDTNEAIPYYDPIYEGAELNLASATLREGLTPAGDPMNLAIRANISHTDGMDRVAFRIYADTVPNDVNRDHTLVVKRVAPYVLGVETKGDFSPQGLGVGSFSLMSLPFSVEGGLGITKTLNFSIIDEAIDPHFTLIDADDGSIVPGYEHLTAGTTLNLADLPPNLSILANVDGAGVLDFVSMIQTYTDDSQIRRKDFAFPYAFGNEYEGEFQPIYLPDTKRLAYVSYLNTVRFSSLVTNISVTTGAWNLEPATASFEELIALSSSEIALTATDTLGTGLVEYKFDNMTNGTSSGWITSRTWTNIGLDANTEYDYEVTTRDRHHTSSPGTGFAWTESDGTIDTEPKVSITSYTDGEPVLENQDVVVTVNASDDSGIARVYLWSKEAAATSWSFYGSYTAAPYEWNLGNLPIGFHTLIARAVPNDDPTSFVVDTLVVEVVEDTGPIELSVTVTSSYDDAGNVIVTADAQDDSGINRVWLKLDSTWLRPADTVFPYEWNLGSLPIGSHTVTAKAHPNDDPTSFVIGELVIDVTD